MLTLDPSIVVPATTDDIPGIIAVLEENLLSNKDQLAIDDLEQGGFLIMRYSAEELRAWIEDKESHIILVCRRAQEVMGYILSCDLTAVSAKLQAIFAEVQPLKDILATNPVLYHKQIAIKSNQKGVGSKLLQSFFEIAAKKNYQHIVCLIVHEPVLNKVSMDFHQKHGFEYMELVPFDDVKDGVYLKLLEGGK